MIVPLEEGGGVGVQVEAGLLGVVPLVAEDEHDPGVELGQRGGHVTLASLVEDRADQPQVERVAATHSVTLSDFLFNIILHQTLPSSP